MKVKQMLSGLEKKYFFYTFLTPLVMIGEVLMETLIPLIMAHIIDRGIADRNIKYVVFTGLLMVACAIFSLFCGVCGGRLASLAAYGFSRNLRSRLFARVQGFSFSSLNRFGTGSLVTRLTTDVTNLQNMYLNIIRSMVRAPLMMITGTVIACSINLKLAVLFFIAIPFLGFLFILISSSAYPRFQEMFKKYDALNTVVQEFLTGIRVVKAFVRGDFEYEKFEKIAAQVRDSQVNAEKIVVFLNPVMKMVIYMCIIATLWFGGKMVIIGDMKTGELVSFLTYVTQILMSLMMLNMIFIQFVLARPSVARVMEILSCRTEDEISVEEKENFEKAVKSPEGVKDGSVEFSNVYFSYDDRMDNCVLSDINLKIPSGSTVGIIGGTGSSKSTLVSLIPRLYDCTKGCVKVGGIDVREYGHKVLRQSVAVVLQKNLLFSGTIEENLKWGNENADREQIEQACRLAQAWDFVSELPDGLDTELGQGGVNLSGGQKQRLCIARALLKNPAILILDDSTSAVDTATDLKIRTALKECLPETTKIIIAQRVASVQEADFIAVLDDGRLSGTGTHETLLKENKIYREVYESQMSRN